MSEKGRAKVKFTVEQADALSVLVHKSRVSGDSSIMALLKECVFKNLSAQMTKRDIYGKDGLGLLKDDFDDLMDDVRMAYSRAVKVAYPKIATKGQLKEVEFESIVYLSELVDADVIQSLRDHFVEGKKQEGSKEYSEGLISIGNALKDIHAFRESIVSDEKHRKFMNIPEKEKKAELSQEMIA